MGRRANRQTLPRGVDRQSDQEVRHSHMSPFPKSFGIRLLLVESQCVLILNRLAELQAQEDIPESVKLRKSLHVVLLPRRVFSGQVLKGLATGYNLRGLQNRLERTVPTPIQEKPTATIKQASVYRGRTANLIVDSPEIEAMRSAVSNTMESVGLRGLHRAAGEKRLHVSWGDSKRSLTPTEQRHVEHIVPEEISELFVVEGIEPVLTFEPDMQYNPDLDLWAR